MTPGAATATGAAQLRSRLGKGARFDAPGAPAGALLLARRGMAFFARQLNMLTDQDLAGPSLLAGWRRAHVVTETSVAARSQALLLTALRGGVLDDEFDWEPDVDLTATLPPRALRHLFDHAHVHLNVEWRDLAAAGWSGRVAVAPGETLPVSDLPLRHASVLWWGAVALNGPASAAEIPAGVPAPPGPLAAICQKTASPPHHPAGAC